jgi:hypothetical protein
MKQQKQQTKEPPGKVKQTKLSFAPIQSTKTFIQPPELIEEETMEIATTIIALNNRRRNRLMKTTLDSSSSPSSDDGTIKVVKVKNKPEPKCAADADRREDAEDNKYEKKYCSTGGWHQTRHQILEDSHCVDELPTCAAYSPGPLPGIFVTQAGPQQISLGPTLLLQNHRLFDISVRPQPLLQTLLKLSVKKHQRPAATDHSKMITGPLVFPFSMDSPHKIPLTV